MDSIKISRRQALTTVAAFPVAAAMAVTARAPAAAPENDVRLRLTTIEDAGCLWVAVFGKSPTSHDIGIGVPFDLVVVRKEAGAFDWGESYPVRWHIRKAGTSPGHGFLFPVGTPLEQFRLALRLLSR